MRKYLITVSCSDTSFFGKDFKQQFGKDFKQQYVIKGYQKAKTIVNDILKYQSITGYSCSMKLLSKK